MTQGDRGKDVSSEATTTTSFPMIARILRTVPEENAFYFFTGIGQYTGSRASSLAEFLEYMRTIEIPTIEFHAPRGDFENWFLTTLGDANLAREAFVSRSKKGDDLRSFLERIVRARLARLEKFR